MRRSIVATALAVAGLAGGTLFAVAPAASASGQACATKSLSTAYRAHGSTVNKSGSSGCSDLNLTYSNDSTSNLGDSYAGFYRNSSGSWIRGSRGYVWADDGSHSPWIVLLSDVSSGTPMGVGSYYDGGDSVTVAH
ncbi:hypothetical protein [Streptomyces sp. H39-S7]|uniref:hypothetical protein n=1 Tax=Streptomyces sp. H39-S7 TaxID=3004357 RepID=UPI0022AFAFB6|nr:hypothetical protein [Streptomyces sp. H39-S7]MCZ4121668.1 hypothetical protein [Streptomyces sp. H39-S7]